MPPLIARRRARSTLPFVIARPVRWPLWVNSARDPPCLFVIHHSSLNRAQSAHHNGFSHSPRRPRDWPVLRIRGPEPPQVGRDWLFRPCLARRSPGLGPSLVFPPVPQPISVQHRRPFPLPPSPCRRFQVPPRPALSLPRRRPRQPCWIPNQLALIRQLLFKPTSVLSTRQPFTGWFSSSSMFVSASSSISGRRSRLE